MAYQAIQEALARTRDIRKNLTAMQQQDQKQVAAQQPFSGKMITIVMDITNSYRGWKLRTRNAVPEVVTPYGRFRFIGMNDNCNRGNDCDCDTCKNSIRVEPWRTDIKQLQAGE